MSILIVDDDPNICWVLTEYMESQGYVVLQAEDGEKGLAEWRKHSPKLILLDYRLPGIDGLEFMRQLHKETKNTPPEIVIITSHGETKVVVEAMKLGAADFIDKPFDIETIGFIIKNVFEKRELKDEIKILQEELQTETAFKDLIGDSNSLNLIKDLIQQIANVNATVLLVGESGTGKDLIANLIHQNSDRRRKNFIKINCAALPEHLLESELFGYEKGAFTGALKRKKGKFEMAHEGTIYLDEIGEMSSHLQAKLLHVLQDNTYAPLGSEQNVWVDTRIVAATNIDIELAVSQGRFRADLYYRLNVININVPPLRQHPEDIPLLSERFLVKYCNEYKRPHLEISPASLVKMMGFHWPGNVRQLENVIKQYVIFQNESVFEKNLAATPQAADKTTPTAPQPTETTRILSLKEVSKQATLKAERDLISEVLRETDWNRTETAKILQISYKSLLNKIKETGLDR